MLRGPPVFSPTWSPDGKWIAYLCTDQPDMSHTYVYICLVRPNGKGNHRITSVGDNDASPSWSPDGKQLLFARLKRGNFDLLAWSLRTHRTRLVLAGESDDSSPTWSPDGKSIAFTRDVATDFEHPAFDIYVADANGKNARVLVQDASDPDWQPLRRTN